MLAIGFRDGKETNILGTAFVIAPGLAVSAQHIFEDSLGKMKEGKVAPFAVGIHDNEGAYWEIKKISYRPDSDLALLSIIARSKMPPDDTYYMFPITTRTVEVGEHIQILGFREGLLKNGQIDTLGFNLCAAQGKVTQVYPNGRDKVMLPFPVIEIDAGSLGGMSGGVATSHDGRVVGVISSGLDTMNGSGTTYISWIASCLTQNVEIVWPEGFYNDETSILDIDPRCVSIEGRNAIKVLDGNKWRYRIWTK